MQNLNANQRLPIRVVQQEDLHRKFETLQWRKEIFLADQCKKKRQRTRFHHSSKSETIYSGTLSENVDMGVSKNSGTPKWMVYNGNPY